MRAVHALLFALALIAAPAWADAWKRKAFTRAPFCELYGKQKTSVIAQICPVYLLPDPETKAILRTHQDLVSIVDEIKEGDTPENPVVE